MIPELLVALFLVVCYTIFFLVNLHNILSNRRDPESSPAYAEIASPFGLRFTLTAVGTLVYFLEVLIYISVIILNWNLLATLWFLQLHFLFEEVVQIVGIGLVGLGCFIFLWSVVVRGKHSVAWAMREEHQLVTWGPYRYVRHPSYLGYFLMFIGFFLLTLNLIALVPWMAIPGYVSVTVYEELLLVQRFGDRYRQYQSRTGRFLPRRRRSQETDV
jgi:protein-S-isoprenylcysteine O-methyltransferase Ste14